MNNNRESKVSIVISRRFQLVMDPEVMMLMVGVNFQPMKNSSGGDGTGRLMEQ